MQLTLAPTNIGRPTKAQEAAPNAHLSAYKAFFIYTHHGNLVLVFTCFLFFLAAQCTRQVRT